MNYVIFEDGRHNNFYPLSLTRPLWDLKSGIFTFKERTVRFLEKSLPDFNNDKLFFFTRDYLADQQAHLLGKDRVNRFDIFSDKEDFLFLNAALVPDDTVLKMAENCALVRDETPIAAHLKACPCSVNSTDSITDMILEHCDCMNINYEEPSDFSHCDYIWDLVSFNNINLKNDIESMALSSGKPDTRCVTVSGDESRCFTHADASVEPFVSICTEKGPVYIDKGAVVHSFTRIEGPCYIGQGSQILGARLRGGCSIGPGCRVGGEVESSIFMAYSNKYHDGFIGHSVVGEWVNLGALTTNSDLKNNYSPVKVQLEKTIHDTGELKIGAFIGDFVKTGIGTLLPTGAVLGTGSMLIHDRGVAPSHVQPFTWYRDGELSFREWFQKFLHIAETAASRRGVTFSSEYIDVLEKVYRMKTSGKGDNNG